MTRSSAADAIQAGDELPPLTIPLTVSRIVACAIATGDFEPIHHDLSAARRAGKSDVFMNILAINGFMQRCVTDWAGPAARIQSIKLALGGSAVAGDTLTITGKVISRPPLLGGGGQLEIELTGITSLGHCASARVVMTLDEMPAPPI